MLDIKKTIVSNFERQVLKTPNSVAIKTISETTTYTELNNKANSAAKKMISFEKSSTKGHISLLFGHEIDMVVGILAVLKSGNAYVPLDSSYPLERLKFMYDNSESSFLLTNKKNSNLGLEITRNKDSLIFIEDCYFEETSNLDLPINNDALAYILYTSGSTGNPKGVCQTHHNILHHIEIWIENLKITSNDNLSLQSAYSWDSAAQDIFGAILSGACLYPVKIKEDSIHEIINWYTNERITIWHSTLPIYRSICKELESKNIKWNWLKCIALGGDALHQKDVLLFNTNFSNKTILVNAYGSTESSSGLMNFISNNETFKGNIVPLGKPVKRTDVYLENENGERLNNVEAIGEIIIRSKFIAPKYWNTNESVYDAKFTKESDSDIIKYRTGDIGKLLDDGAIELIGRNDFQVKISGIRVNTSEIEAILREIPFVHDAIVKAFNDKLDISFLTAYIVLNTGIEFTVNDIRDYLTQRVPMHMIPEKYMFLEKLPLTANNKIDRERLSYPDNLRPRLNNSFSEATSELEKLILSIWKEILDIESIGIDDPFFYLGGNSLRLVNVNILLNKKINKPVSMIDMYRLPTIKKMAKFISENNNDSNINVNLEKGIQTANKRLNIKRKNNGR
nr:non-ribosomal peptide synthetase [uncultured Flavobacterium sp.]